MINCLSVQHYPISLAKPIIGLNRNKLSDMDYLAGALRTFQLSTTQCRDLTTTAKAAQFRKELNNLLLPVDPIFLHFDSMGCTSLDRKTRPFCFRFMSVVSCIQTQFGLAERKDFSCIQTQFGLAERKVF